MAQIFYQLKVCNALIGPYLQWIKKAEDVKYWWCTREVAQSWEHLFKHCKYWRKCQNVLWQAVKQASGRGKSNTSMKDHFGDHRCSERVIQFLRSTEVGRRFRERGLEEDDPGGLWIPKLGRWDVERCLEQQDDGFWKLCMCLDCIVFLFLVFVIFCFHYFFCNALRVIGFSPSGWCFALEGRGVGNLSWPLRG
jgi:hypothetical protein